MKSEKLLIVESPAKAKTISKYLNGEYTVLASVGHVRDLPKSNKKAIDVEGGFIPHYEISFGKDKVLADIKSKAANAKQILLATDPDREGEAIAWHIKEALNLKNSKRVTFYEITKEAVEEAIKHPREIDDNLRRAQEARRVLDRLVGYDLSGIIWKKVRYGLSAGRVQSPALRILVEKEREIRAFIPEAYYPVSAQFKTKGKDVLEMSCIEEIKDKARAEEVKVKAEKASWAVASIEESEVKRSSRPPFTTSTLQQTASSRFGFAPSRTMGIAQKLYEAGHITYMRTDSTNISKSAIGEAVAVITKNYGKQYSTPKTFASKSKNAQEAHEAIRPSHCSLERAGNTEDEKKLYNLIRARFLASQMADAKTLRTKITATADAGAAKTGAGASASKTKDIPDFSITGSRVIFDGWLKADPDATGEDVILPKLQEKDPLDLQKIEWIEKFTEPPNRYTEAGLVKELEKRGIGRPSTYASIIKTLEDREYVNKVNKALVPTDTGEVVSSFLENHFGKYISDDFTAEMEDKLDDIAIGKAEYAKTLKKFYDPLVKDIKIKEKMDKVTNLGDAEAHHECPKCSANMIIKLGRTGKFLSCSKYPECDGALTMDGEQIKGDTPIGVDPTSGMSIYVKVGKYGPYVQLGDSKVEGADGKMKKIKGAKPKMASIPKGKELASVTVEDAMTYLSLPKVLGQHPDTGKNITASIGRFGPYIVHDTDFRSLKKDDVYSIDLKRALEILAEPKVVGRRGRKKSA